VVTARRPTIRSSKELLRPLSLHLEQRSLTVEPGVLLACFQDAVHFTPATRERYEKLAGAAVLTGALGVGMPAVPVAGVRGGRLEPDEPLRGEWDVVVVGPQSASALVARDLGDTGPDRERRFDAVITHDRDLVIQAALTLVYRLLAARPGVAPDAWATPA
jgi:DICT domain-containing protein